MLCHGRHLGSKVSNAGPNHVEKKQTYSYQLSRRTFFVAKIINDINHSTMNAQVIFFLPCWNIAIGFVYKQSSIFASLTRDYTRL